MKNKQLSRIADALEKIAGNQSELLVVMKASSDKSNQDLGTHASMFSEMREMIEPLLAGAVSKMGDRSSPTKKEDPVLPPQPKVIERNGIRLVASTPNQIEVDVE